MHRAARRQPPGEHVAARRLGLGPSRRDRYLQNLPAALRISPEQIPPWHAEGSAGLEDPDPALIRQDMSAIKQVMWNYVGLVARPTGSAAR